MATGAGEAAPLLGGGSARRTRAWLWWRRDAAAGAEPRSKAPPARQSKLLRVCSFILGNEACERLAYYGLSTNLIVYLTTVLGFNSAVAAQQVNLWSGMCYVTSLMGAWIADEFMGRYRTIVTFSFVYLGGCVLLTASSFVPPMAPAAGGENGADAVLPLFTALYLIAVGTGGIKSNVSSFGADQFDESIPQDAREKDSFFAWFYLVINCGSLVSSTVIVYIQQSISWSIGFAIPTVFMGLAIVIFLLGSGSYRITTPAHSPISRFCSVVGDALRNTFDARSREVFSILARSKETGTLTWLDRAAAPVGRFTAAQVYEVKLVAGLIPVMLVTIVYWAVYAQMGTTFVLQGMQMNRNCFGIQVPAAAIVSFDTVTVILMIPLFDRLVYPLLKRRGVPISLLQKMGWGMVLALLALVYAGFLERYRLNAAHHHHLVPAGGGQPEHLDPGGAGRPLSADVSIFWQIPAYVLIGTSEILASIGQLEFFYDQAPDAMRSCCMAMQLVSTALGAFLASGIVSVVSRATERDPWMPVDLNDGHLDRLFFVLAALAGANILAFAAVAANYKHKDLEHGREPLAQSPRRSPSQSSLSGDDAESPGEASPYIDIRRGAQQQQRPYLHPVRSLTETAISPAIPSQMR